RHVRSGEAVKEALSLDVADRLADHALVELVDHPRLADARLAADPDDLALASDRRVEATPEELDLTMAAGERRRMSAEPPRPPPREDEHAAERAAREVQQLEAALEERCSGSGDEDRAGLTVLDERGEHLDRLLPGHHVELRRPRAEPHQTLLEVDPDRRRRRPGIPLADPHTRLLDRHRGVRGPARRVLDRVEPECRQNTRGVYAVYAPAEARDFLDQDLEPAARLDLRIRLRARGDLRPQQRHAPALPPERGRRRRSGRGGRRGPRERGSRGATRRERRRRAAREAIPLDPRAKW